MTLVPWCLGLLVSIAVVAPASAAELIYRDRISVREDVAVTAEGRPVISMREVHAAFAIEYYNIAVDLHRRQVAWLRKYVEDGLIALEAQKRGVTPEALLEADVKPADGTDEVAARRQYVEKLWRAAKIEVKLPAPARPQVIVSEGNTSPVLGLSDGPVNVILFCAFTSADCKDQWDALRTLVNEHGWRVRIVHRDYPSDAGESLSAAIAARCAHRQGKFWAYHDRLYEVQKAPGAFAAAQLKGYAKALGLDTAQFDACIDNRQTAQEVEQDAWEARRVGVPVLPAMFINTLYVGGLTPLAELRPIIDDANAMMSPPPPRGR